MNDIEIKGFKKFLNHISFITYIIPVGFVIWAIIAIVQEKKPNREGYLTKTSQKFRFIFSTCYLGLMAIFIVGIIIGG
tara:strand:+ start:550 stop:783 length:234 start_codon:yes stop_codon:yes gene_type:complete